MSLDNLDIFLSLDQSDVASVDLLDPGSVDWPRAHRTAYLVHQHLRYEYPGTVEDLRHRLMLIAPPEHGDQRRIMHRLDVDCADTSTVTTTEDGFGNTVIEVAVASVSRHIAFEAWMVLERRPMSAVARLPVDSLSDERYTNPTRLTQPDEALAALARRYRDTAAPGLDLAAALNRCVHEAMSYAHGVTDIATTAAEALGAGQGVCQDYAHILLALCRFCDIPARYVSGHLLGEGGTHAWVEVLIADTESGGAIAQPLDPTHGEGAGPRHLTVAVGRDYSDVAPTSGTFRASFPGQLSTRKRVGVVGVEYSS